ncbi:MAG TPA: MoxR family ATPase [Ilumatobacteraceae bacterium]|nr:MoxR family ATPase [Ilumatobacteraceae bacterium]
MDTLPPPSPTFDPTIDPAPTPPIDRELDAFATAPGPVAALGARLIGTMNAVVAGKAEVIDVSVATLLAGGHLLIEDIPGVGKTLLAQVMARAAGGSFHRIQGTSDLLPGDITGSMVPSGRLDVDGMRFRPGPVFANVVVFDELNRATPRTQSALLELAEEATVTVDGVSHRLPEPFMLVATQNPIDMAGTYGLGEGALDRFHAVVTPGRASADAELEVLTGRRGRSMLDAVEPVVTLDELVAARAAVARVQVSDVIAAYVVELLDATRRDPRIRVGASTRGGVAIVALARAFAALGGRTYVTPHDVVRASVPALAHRVAGATAPVAVGRDLAADCVAKVPVPSL